MVDADVAGERWRNAEPGIHIFTHFEPASPIGLPKCVDPSHLKLNTLTVMQRYLGAAVGARVMRQSINLNGHLKAGAHHSIRVRP